MKINKIKLQGIQSIEDGEIELSDGLTVICGPSDSGKTAMATRAIKQIFQNPEAKDLSTKDMAVIELCFDTGDRITWEKRKKGKSFTTSYIVNGVPYTSMGRQVPEKVLAIASSFRTKNENFGLLQLHEQGAAPFLTTKMSAEVGRAWDLLEGTMYREALDACEKSVRTAHKKLLFVENELNFIEEEITPKLLEIKKLEVDSDNRLDLFMQACVERIDRVAETLRIDSDRVQITVTALFLRKKEELKEISTVMEDLSREIKEVSQELIRRKLASINVDKMIAVVTMGQAMLIHLSENIIMKELAKKEIELSEDVTKARHSIVENLDCPYWQEHAKCVMLEMMVE